MEQKFKFYLFGMGGRNKYYYRNGKLFSFLTNQVIYQWDIASEHLQADRYTLTLTLKNGEKVILFEDEQGFYINQDGKKTAVSESYVCLPEFEQYRNPELIRILHHEILVNIHNGLPLPNIYVYKKPWYRDGAMMAMVLKKTGNIALIKDWILSIKECYDKNNRSMAATPEGFQEPDNLGQGLFLLSCVTDKSHPMVQTIIDEAKRIMENGILTGTVDYRYHPVYANKWLKYGLEQLGLENDWVQIPEYADDYDPLFWFDYRDYHTPVPHRDYDKDYPYLWWAEQHFYGNEINLEEVLPEKVYPVTNETKASEADYELIRPLCEEYADMKNASPHTWHAAEMFLYLIEKER